MAGSREVEVYEGKDGKFYYRVKSTRGGKIVLDAGQGYDRKDDAVSAARREFGAARTYHLSYTREDGHGGKEVVREELLHGGVPLPAGEAGSGTAL